MGLSRRLVVDGGRKERRKHSASTGVLLTACSLTGRTRTAAGLRLKGTVDSRVQEGEGRIKGCRSRTRWGQGSS